MDDLGAKDVASAMAFVSGAENDSTYHQESIASLGSANGYVGGDFGDNNTRTGEIRVRGLGRVSSMVNFIEVLGSTDRYPIDLHFEGGVRPKHLQEGVVPTVPLRALIPEGSRNLLVASRGVSSDRLENSALRVQASCMGMGQAAGEFQRSIAEF